MHKIKNVSKLCLIIFLCIPLLTFAKEKELTLGFLQTENHPVMKWLTYLYTDAFNQIGINIQSKYYPADLLTNHANEGLIDGELGRSYPKEHIPSNLVKIPVPHWEAQFVAYSTNKNLKITSWEDLKGKNLKVECLKGIKVCESKLPYYIPEENISIAKESIQALRRLKLKRTDVFIFTKLGVQNELKYKEFEDTNIYYSGTLEKLSANAYLHKKHKELIPKLVPILEKMKKNGDFIKYKIMAERKRKY